MTEREHDMRQRTSDDDRSTASSTAGSTVKTVRARRRRMETLLVAGALLFVGWFYHWTVWANNGFEDWGDNDYYRLLVRGWKKGQLSLDRAPSPELLALADPYDPTQNGPHRLGDASLFRGKYYLYFGAAPALTLMLPFNLITGREMGTGTAVFWFCIVAFVAASGLWLAIRRRFFSDSGMWIAPIGVLAIGFGTHLLALAQRPMFWELPIAGGIAFTMLALVCVYCALHGRRPLLAMAMAGVCLGLAVGSRPTCLLAAPMLLAPIAFAWFGRRENDDAGRWWKLALAAAVPLGGCGLAIMAHNYARFENVFEFGQHYQLSGAYESKWVHFSPRFITHNIGVYLFQPVKWTWSFPFVSAQSVHVHIPGYFGTEEVCGIAATFLSAWFVLGLPFAWSRRTGEARGWNATVAAIAGYLVPVAGLLLSYFSTTARYQSDFGVVFGVLAACGLLGLERVAQRARAGSLVVTTLAAALAFATVVMGVLVSFDYHGRMLSRTRADLWAKLEQRSHRMLGNAGLLLGQFDGPRVLKVRFRAQPMGTVEPFWQARDTRAAERIVVEHIGEQLIRFGYVRGTDPTRWGRPLTWEKNHTHTVGVQLPSLYRPPGGRMRGLREDLEFRERTGVAVWFSGGRALDAIVEPLAPGISPGGTVAENFSGEVRRQWTRLSRDDEVRETNPLPLHEPRGGTLQLRFSLADPIASAGEPLFASGVLYGSDIVFVRAVGDGFKVVFEHFGAPQVESAVIARTREPHTIEVVLPSCRRGDEAFGGTATGDVIVRLDGVEIIRTQQTCIGFPVGSEGIGRNPFGTTCGPAFRGWILKARWVDQ